MLRGLSASFGGLCSECCVVPMRSATYVNEYASYAEPASHGFAITAGPAIVPVSRPFHRRPLYQPKHAHRLSVCRPGDLDSAGVEDLIDVEVTCISPDDTHDVDTEAPRSR